MNLEELNIILARGENTRTEFKEAKGNVPGSFYQTVAAFLNREGGIVVLGADDDGNVTGIDEFLFQKGSSWLEKGVKLKSARINKINDLQFDNFQKGPSWLEKGVKLLPKRMITILKLLTICILPNKIEEIKQILSFGSRDKLRKLYLNPLRKEGMIETTVKEKPNSPEQKYVLTEKGRLFLGGFEIT